MKTTIKCLLAQRSDGKFLRLHENQHTTEYDFVVEPELAKRIILFNPTDSEYINLKDAIYYFENSWRAKELWLKNCVMVAYEITTNVNATKLQLT